METMQKGIFSKIQKKEAVAGHQQKVSHANKSQEALSSEAELKHNNEVRNMNAIEQNKLLKIESAEYIKENIRMGQRIDVLEDFIKDSGLELPAEE